MPMPLKRREQVGDMRQGCDVGGGRNLANGRWTVVPLDVRLDRAQHIYLPWSEWAISGIS
jgi:hypothetical protein